MYPEPLLYACANVELIGCARATMLDPDSWVLVGFCFSLREKKRTPNCMHRIRMSRIHAPTYGYGSSIRVLLCRMYVEAPLFYAPKHRIAVYKPPYSMRPLLTQHE
jgi:hypothetical protein